MFEKQLTWHVICDSLHNLTTFPRVDSLALVVSSPTLVLLLFMTADCNLLVFVDMPKELDVDSNVMTGELPWVEVKPVVRDFDLISINDFLFEDTYVSCKL